MLNNKLNIIGDRKFELNQLSENITDLTNLITSGFAAVDIEGSDIFASESLILVTCYSLLITQFFK